MICERCSEHTAKLEKCEYCGRSICRRCEKAGKRVKKLKHLIICKDCWGNLEARKMWKRA